MARLIDITGKAITGEWGNDLVGGNGIPVLRTTNFTDEGIIDFSNTVLRDIPKKDLTQKYLRKGDIIIEKSGGSDTKPVGRVVFFDSEENTYLINNFTGILRVKDLNLWDPRYLFYALFHNYIIGGTRIFENRTTGLHNLQLDKYLNSFIIKENDLPTQRRIAATLDKVSEGIDLCRKMLGNLDELVKSQFVEMFGDTASSDWRTMAEICSIITDGTHQPPKFVSDGIPFLFVSNITRNILTYNAEKFIDEQTYHELIKRTPIEVGDILLSTVGSYGHPAVVKEPTRFCFQRHIAYLKPKADMVDSDYLHGAILSSIVQAQIEEKVKGIAQKTLNLSEIRTIRVPVPEIHMQRAFAHFAAETDKSKFAIRQQLSTLETLKKSLMQKYFG